MMNVLPVLIISLKHHLGLKALYTFEPFETLSEVCKLCKFCKRVYSKYLSINNIFLIVLKHKGLFMRLSGSPR